MANVRQCCSPLTPPIKRLKATPIVSTRQGLLTRPLIGTYHKQLRTHCLSVWTRQPEKPNTILYTSRDTEENTYIYNIIIEYVCIYIIYLWYTYMIYLYDINKQNTEIFWAWVKDLLDLLKIGFHLLAALWSLYPDTHNAHMMTRYILLYQIPQIFQIWQFTQIYPWHSLVGDLTSEMTFIEYKWS